MHNSAHEVADMTPEMWRSIAGGKALKAPKPTGPSRLALLWGGYSFELVFELFPHSVPVG